MQGRSETFTVEDSLPHERFDIFLRARFPGLSRGTIQRLIEERHIQVNGKPIKATHHPRAGEIISIFWPEAKPAQAQPEKIALDILFEDEDLLVLNKPPGIVVHPAAGNAEHTLVNALLHHCAGKLSGIGGVARPGIVHRLDKDTSGCLVVAKTDAAHQSLAEQFAGRSVEKIYHAIVCGEMTKKSGEISGAIARHPIHRKQMAVTTDGKGRSARTGFRVLESLRGATLAEALLFTGRTHQIRVHFQHLGFPVLGDTVYGTRQNKRAKEILNVSVPRQMLHAQHLAFLHPRTGKTQSCDAPYPNDFSEALQKLRGVADPVHEPAGVRK
ncbi:MAG: RluA family pseudouridine synthase [Verrucomicrobiota bacterium]